MDTAPHRNPGQLTFRDATDADVPALVELIQSAYRGDSSRAGWTTEADILEGQRTDPQGVRDVVRAPAAGCSSWNATARRLPAASSNTAVRPPTSECSRSDPRSRARDSAS